VTQDEVRDKLVDYVENAHAMEQGVLRMLDSMISRCDDVTVRELLEKHRQETEQHERLLRQRLEALEAGTSVRKEAQALAGTLMKGVMDMVRSDSPGKDARDAYVTEHAEIAAYELLSRLAERAGDAATAEVAKRICLDERAMAEAIEVNWDRFVDMTLQEIGVTPVIETSEGITTR
jgi:ferritin-like metal-binding protein YciE